MNGRPASRADMERTAPLGEKKVVAALAAAEKTPMCIPREEFAFHRNMKLQHRHQDVFHSPTKVVHYDTVYTVMSHNYIGTIWTP